MGVNGVPWASDDDAEPETAAAPAHIYDLHHCIFCDVNDLDNDLYGPFPCVDRPPYVYTTETGDAPATDAARNGLVPLDQLTAHR